MKSLFTVLFLFIFTALSFAQKNALVGVWESYSEEFHYSEPTGRIIITPNGEARWEHSEGFYFSKIKARNSNCISTEKSIVHYTSFNLAWAYECANNDSVEVYSITGTAIGNPFLLYAQSTRSKTLKNNNLMDVNCFNSGCNYDYFQSILKKKTNRIVLEENIFVGSTPNEFLKVEEVRFTDNSTEVLLFFDEMEESYGGTLHEPGADYAFFIRDNQGNRFNLLTQVGWPGEKKNGFGSFTIPAYTEQHILLIFEPIPAQNTVNNLNLIEGTCEGGCWNFYDIRLKDR